MIGVDVRSNISQVVAEFRSDTRGLVPKATERALNRALDQAATEAKRLIGGARGRYNVKVGVVEKAFKKIKASTKGAGVLVAILRVAGARIALIQFSPSERTVRTAHGKRRAVSVKVLRGGERKVVKGGFIGTLRGGTSEGTKGIFRRTGRERYPIKFRRSVSIPQAFSKDVVLAAVKKVASESFTKNFEQQIRFLGERR